MSGRLYHVFLKAYQGESLHQQTKARYGLTGLLIATGFMLIALTVHLILTPQSHLLLGDSLGVISFVIALILLKDGHLRASAITYVSGIFAGIFVYTALADGFFNEGNQTHYFHLFQTLALSLIALMFLALLAVNRKQLILTSFVGGVMILVHFILYGQNPLLLMDQGAFMVVAVALLEYIFGAAAVILIYGLSQELIQLADERTQLAQRHQHALEVRTVELQRSNHDLQLFAYSASHDLQEPMRLVSGYIHIMRKELEKPRPDMRKIHKYLEYMSNGNNRMEQLVNNLFLFSDTHIYDKSKEAVDLNEVIRDVRYDLSMLIEEHEAEIRHEFLPIIHANRQQMLQLFGHLISNGIKFKQAGLKPIIRIDCETIKNSFEIKVRDNGIGIAPEHQQQVFDLFRRAPHGPLEKGTGIGLALCRKIMEKHEGSIRLQSVVNEGSTFTISLPKVISEEKAQSLVQQK